MPKTVFSTTAQPATMKVTWNACRAPSVVSAFHTGPMPFSNVRQKTRPTGITSRKAR